MSTNSTIEHILNLAKWAPSGDNTQPWRFEIINEHQVNVHGFDTRKECVYDFRGHASHIALGALIENICIAATCHKLRADVTERPDCSDEHPVFEVKFVSSPGVDVNPLHDQIRLRSVHRRPYKTTPLTPEQKSALEKSLGASHRVVWLEGLQNRFAMARLVSAAGKLRLTIPEAYLVHRNIIQWNSQFSEDKVPDQAIGLDRMSLHLMRWALTSWERVDFFNTFLAGTLLPRIQLDIIPALACAAHFILLAESIPSSVADYVTGGRAMQRFWLTATKLGLQLQPEMSALIFRNYATNGVIVSTKPGAQRAANTISIKFNGLAGNKQLGNQAIFMGRLGKSPPPIARSLRLSLERLFL